MERNRLAWLKCIYTHPVLENDVAVAIELHEIRQNLVNYARLMRCKSEHVFF